MVLLPSMALIIIPNMANLSFTTLLPYIVLLLQWMLCLIVLLIRSLECLSVSLILIARWKKQYPLGVGGGVGPPIPYHSSVHPRPCRSHVAHHISTTHLYIPQSCSNKTVGPYTSRLNTLGSVFLVDINAR